MGSVALIVIWFVPVAFVGTLSSVSTLCEKVSWVPLHILCMSYRSNGRLIPYRWLCWIRSAPTPVPGIIQGILPPLFLAILFAILPWLLKGKNMAKFARVERLTRSKVLHGTRISHVGRSYRSVSTSDILYSWSCESSSVCMAGSI